MPVTWPHRLESIGRGQRRKFSIKVHHRNLLSSQSPEDTQGGPWVDYEAACMLLPKLLGNNSEIRGVLLGPDSPTLCGWTACGNMHWYFWNLDIYSPKKPHLEIVN